MPQRQRIRHTRRIGIDRMSKFGIHYLRFEIRFFLCGERTDKNWAIEFTQKSGLI